MSICPVCLDEYTPRQVRQITCGSEPCRHRYKYLKMRDRLHELEGREIIDPPVSEVFMFSQAHPTRRVDLYV